MTGADADGTDAAWADWALLDLAPGADERTLRSAYARKLKTVRPEADPQGFQALRAAYERLRASASAASAPAAARAEGSPDGEAGATEAGAAKRRDLVHRFDSLRRRGDIDGALRVVDEALSGSLRMAWRQAVEDGLFDSVARDPSARRALIQALAARFDWREATTRQEARDADGMAELRGRIEAADFIDALRAREKAARAGDGPPGDRLLIRLLAPYRVGTFDRGLDADEREVGAVLMNAVFEHLAEADDVIDARTIAALRGSLGAAPFGKPPPDRVGPGETAAEPVAARAEPVVAEPVVDAPGKRRWGASGGLWLIIVLLAVGNGVRLGSQHWDGGARSRPALGYRSDRPPPLEMSFPVREQDGRLGIDLSPLLTGSVRAQLSGVRLDNPGEDAQRTVTLDDLAAAPVRYLPAGKHVSTLTLVFPNGDTTGWYQFDLDRREAPPASSSDPQGPGR